MFFLGTFLPAGCLISEPPMYLDPQPQGSPRLQGEEGAELRSCASENRRGTMAGNVQAGNNQPGTAHVEELPDWLDLF